MVNKNVASAFGVQRDETGQGTSPYDIRTLIDAMWMTPGIITGLEVSGTNTLSYHVNAGAAVCSKSRSDGKTMAPFHGGNTPAVNAGDPSNPRIDVVWIIAHNRIEDGDTDNLVTVGVTQGTPSINPVAPTIPAGATELQQFRVPANALTTNSAVLIGYPLLAVQTGGSLGLLGEYWDKSDGVKGYTKLNQSEYALQCTINLPAPRYVELLYKNCFNGEGSKGSQDTSHPSEFHMCFQLDGKDIPHTAENFISYGGWETHMTLTPTIIPMGQHTLRVRGWLGYGSAPHFRYTSDQSSGWIGQLFQIWDKAPANPRSLVSAS